MQVVEVIVAIPQLHRVRHPRVVGIRVVTQRQFPLAQAVQQTIELPQLQFIDEVVHVPCCAGRASFVKLAQGELVGALHRHTARV